MPELLGNVLIPPLVIHSSPYLSPKVQGWAQPHAWSIIDILSQGKHVNQHGHPEASPGILMKDLI